MVYMDVLVKDVVIDEDAFNAAVQEFSSLSNRLSELRRAIDSTLDGLTKGFDTPAGRKLVAAYKDTLVAPLDDQRLVIDHVSENLKYAKQAYSSVFDEYNRLNSTINSVRY
jgi:hypothetical protein